MGAALHSSLLEGSPKYKYQTLVSALEHSSKLGTGITFPGQHDDERTLSYAELFEKAQHLLAVLQQQNVSPGTPVILQIEDLPLFCTCFWACLLGGIKPVTIAIPPIADPKHAIASKLVGTTEVIDSPIILTESHLRERLATLLPSHRILSIDNQSTTNFGKIYRSAKPYDIAFFQLSSGSTGKPKVIPETHYAVIRHSHITSEFNHYQDDEILLNWLPMDHVVPLLMFHCFAVVMGFNQVMLKPDLIIRDPRYWLHYLEKYQITRSWAPNFAFKMVVDQLANHPYGSWDLSRVRSLINAGEQVTVSVMQQFYDTLKPHQLPAGSLCIMYGMAELATAICAEYYNQQDSLRCSADAKGQQFVAVGKLYPNFSLRIVDHDNRLLEEDQIGRVQVKSDTIMPGYLNNTHANQEAFTDDGWFNTGDLGFLQEDVLTISGREKELMIVNGVNIYPYEIEDLVSQIPGVDATCVACCAVRCPTSATDQIALFYVLEEGVSCLNKTIKADVSKYYGLTVQYVIAMEKSDFPKTTSGKIQRARLKSDLEATLRDEGDVMPSEQKTPKHLTQDHDNNWEVTLCQILQSVLKTTVTPESDFFALGGDSITAIQLMATLQTEFGINITIGDLYQYPEISALSTYIQQQTSNTTQHIESAPAKELSYGQQNFRVLNKQLGEDNCAYNQSICLQLVGNVDTDKLRQCLFAIYTRHQVLRLVFSKEITDTHATILPPDSLHYHQFQLGDEKLEECLQELTERPFDLIQGPLFRVYLVRNTFSTHYLLFNFHHAIVDGWSVDILFHELSLLYNDPEARLPQLQINYFDYSAWQQRKTHDIAFWREYLKDAQSTRLPLAESRHPKKMGLAEHVSFNLSDLYHELKNIATTHKTSLFVTLCASLQLLVSRYVGSQDIILGTTINNRDQAETHNLIGYFINTIALRLQFDNIHTISDLIDQCRESIKSAFAHHDVPFEQVSTHMSQHNNFSLSELIMFELIKDFKAPILHNLEATVLPEIQLSHCKFNFSIAFYENEEQNSLQAVIEYNPGLYTKSTASQFANRFTHLLRSIVREPKQSLSAVDYLTYEEQKQLALWNDTHVLYPKWRAFASEYESFTCLHQLFESLVERTPDNLALTFQESTLTYQVLNEKANRLAHFLHEQHAVGIGSRIGVCIPRSPELIVTVLSLLKLGAIFVPLDVSSENQDSVRRKLIHADISQVILSTQTRSRFESNPNVISIVYQESDYQGYADHNFSAPITGETPVYIMYTSGTTGTPKGVVCSHSGLLHWAKVQKFILDVKSEDRIFLCAPITFDASYWEMFMALSHGACLVLNSEEERIQIEPLKKLFTKHHVSIATFTPSMLSLLEPNDFQSLRAITLTGEACHLNLIRQWQNAGKTLYNGYGPTESCIGATLEALDKTSPISIGYPIPEKALHLLGPHGNLLPHDTVGEIYISGAIADGYLNDAQQTNAKFVEITVLGEKQRAYRTGDLGRRRKDGKIEFIARMDRQVKVQGVRIELRALEKALLSHNAIDNAVVVDVEEGARKHLVAFVIFHEGQHLNEMEMKHCLRHATSLPDCALPNKYIPLMSFPQDNNSKINYHQLRKIASLSDYQNGPMEFASPGTLAEQIVILWKSVLKKQTDDMISLNDNFMKIGGTSLLAASMLASVEKQFGAPITWQEFFGQQAQQGDSHYGTAKWLASRIEQNKMLSKRHGNRTIIEVAAHQNVSLTLHHPGSEPAIILLPGLTGKSHYEPLIEELIKNEVDNAIYTTAFNQQGHPLKEDVDTKQIPTYCKLRYLARACNFDFKALDIPRLETLADRILESFQSAYLHHIILVGWSFGGLCAEVIRHQLQPYHNMTLQKVIAIDTNLSEMPLSMSVLDWLAMLIQHIQMVAHNHQIEVFLKDNRRSVYPFTLEHCLNEPPLQEVINPNQSIPSDYRFVLDHLLGHLCVFKLRSASFESWMSFIPEIYTFWGTLRALCEYEIKDIRGKMDLISCSDSDLGWQQFTSPDDFHLTVINSTHNKLLTGDVGTLALTLKQSFAAL